MHNNEVENKRSEIFSKALLALQQEVAHKLSRRFKPESLWAAILEPLRRNGLSVSQTQRSLGNAVEIRTVVIHSCGQEIGYTTVVEYDGCVGWAATHEEVSLRCLAGVLGLEPYKPAKRPERLYVFPTPSNDGEGTLQ